LGTATIASYFLIVSSCFCSSFLIGSTGLVSFLLSLAGGACLVLGLFCADIILDVAGLFFV